MLALQTRVDGNGAETVGADTAGSIGTTLTAHASAHTKATSFTQLIASTSRTAYGLILHLRSFSAVRFSVDVAIGAASGEQVIIPDVVFSGDGSDAAVAFLPIPIPAGSRVSARIQASSGGSTMRLAATLLWTPDARALRRAIAYGFDAANTRGTLLTAPGATHTKAAAYTQIVAATTAPVRAFFVMLTPGSVASAHSGLLDVAVGAAAAEQDLVANLPIRHMSLTRTDPPMIGPLTGFNLPAGVRLSGRIQSNVASTDVGVAILALD